MGQTADEMRWNRSRVGAVGGLAAGAAALIVAVVSAGGAPGGGISQAQAAAATIGFRTVPVGAGRVQVSTLPTGTCFTVHDRGGSTHACPTQTGPPDIGFALTPHGIGGIAGPEVAAVIVRLTHRGTVWATIRGGAFYAAVPSGLAVRAVVKVLRDGSRTAFSA